MYINFTFKKIFKNMIGFLGLEVSKFYFKEVLNILTLKISLKYIC